MKSLHLSIIIPVLNEQALIVPCLQALQYLRDCGHELIVVDGGSTDQSAVLAEPYADKVYVSAQGRALQMNVGASKAAGSLLLFLHVDTRLPQQVHTLLAQALAQSNKCWGRFDIRLSGASHCFRLVEFMINIRSKISAVATGDQCLFVDTELFRNIGGYEEIPLMEDVALSKKLRGISWPLCIADVAVTSSRRWEEQGILKTLFLMWRLRLAYFLGADPQRLAHAYKV